MSYTCPTFVLFNVFALFTLCLLSTLLVLKQALHYLFNWNQLVVRHNLLKHVGFYTFQLIAVICWIFYFFFPCFSFHAKCDSFIFTFNQSKSLNMFKLLINWNQFSIRWKYRIFCCYIEQVVCFKKLNLIKGIVQCPVNTNNACTSSLDAHDQYVATKLLW